MGRGDLMTTLTKQELMALGYGPTFSSDIIRKAKHFMVNEGYAYYSSRRLGRVPVHAVEAILGYSLAENEAI